ncbi:MAG: hypothetical protein EXR57_01175 [Dehalococcoidia bacterium]|nr:hypothetical protein [Dehalococcoidia bacterium]
MISTTDGARSPRSVSSRLQTVRKIVKRLVLPERKRFDDDYRPDYDSTSTDELLFRTRRMYKWQKAQASQMQDLRAENMELRRIVMEDHLRLKRISDKLFDDGSLSDPDDKQLS